MNAAKCPFCTQNITFNSSPKFNQLVTCATCSTLLQVISVSPVELDWALNSEALEEIPALPKPGARPDRSTRRASIHKEKDSFDEDDDDLPRGHNASKRSRKSRRRLRYEYDD